ncbi:hypothetical protein K432DRAFT_410093 [Lepidopterella palustris CBS 459.81]|uniref:C2H2-type domain-containing protein n=1 Tax=Lepidopterella palustris CBS 459.81 TaxID=1314670 RepID=A0A8E2DYY9_9PEZI|nr:hypothetical protein K432DRAFT_410093 [Lepidopterella palustris CBS 459.81]
MTEDNENSGRLEEERHAVEIQHRDRSIKSPETTPQGSVLFRGSKAHNTFLRRSDLPNDNQSAKFERALNPIKPSSSLPSRPGSVSSETIEESNGSTRIRQAKRPHPKRGPAYGSSNGSGDDADDDERGIEDVAVDLENSDESGLKTEMERDLESDDELQSYQDDIERILGAAILGVKKILVQELSNCALLEATDNSGYSNTQSSSPRSQDSPVSSSSKAPHQPQRRKRARGDDRDPGDGGNESDDDEDDRPKKKNENPSPDRLPHRRLKCPFYQRQPEKDHIKRVHTQPLRCSRCWQEMKSDDAFMEHLQKEIICKKRPEPPDDRIRPQILKNLDFKKAPYAHAKNTEEKWKILYSVLFPNENDIPSPYDQHGMSPRFERVLHEALDEELTKELAPALAPILRRIKDRIPAIIENCRLRLMRMSPELDTVYTPSSSLSTIDSEQASQTHGTEPASRAMSRCSGSSSGGLTSSEECRGKAFGKRPQRSGALPSGSSMEDLQESRHGSSPGSSPDRSMLGVDTANNSQPGGNEDSIDLSTRDSSTLFAVPDSFPGSSIDSTEVRNSPHDKDQRRGLNKPYDNAQAATDATCSQYPPSDLSWSLVTTLDSQSEQNQNEYVHDCDPLPSTCGWRQLLKDIDFSQFIND